jgi:uncharacterized membrane protein
VIGLPPLPGWTGLHPLVVHFPVALLLVAPLFVLVGLLLGAPRNRSWLAAALALLALGTVGAWFAVATGEAAGTLAERSAQINAALEHHEALAERTRAVFTVLTAALAAILLAPAALRRPLARVPQTTLLGLFLVAYLAGAALLANTAHAGGRLVHQLGVRALVADTGPFAPAPAATGTAEGEAED